MNTHAPHGDWRLDPPFGLGRRHAPDRWTDLVAAQWLQAYDAAWLEQDWVRLKCLLAPDVQFSLPRSAAALGGRDEVIGYLREAARQTTVHEYNATDVRGRQLTSNALITYRWQMDRTFHGRRRMMTGRNVLGLRSDGRVWQLLWRHPLAS